jgi:ketosteroid isomerase-like protein
MASNRMISREVDQIASAQQTVVERFYAAFNDGDFEAVVACFHRHRARRWHVAGPRRELQAALPDARLNLVSALAAGETVAVEGRFTGTFTAPLATPQGEVPPTGRTIDVPYADFFTVRDGRIIAHRVYYDQVQLGMALGLMPAGDPTSS